MLLAVIASGAEAQGATVSGIFQMVYGDPYNPAFSPVTLYFVTDATGVTTEVEATTEAFGEFTPRQLVGQQVTVSGNRISLDTVSAITVVPQDAAAVLSQARISVTGINEYVTLLCKFLGDASEDKNVAYVQGLMGPDPPGMEHYWMEQSFDQLDLGNSNGNVYGWFQLDKTRDQYIVSGDFNLTMAAQECTAKANSEEDINFFPFFGINLLFNESFSSNPDKDFAFGGRRTLNLDGQKTYGVTWMPPWGYDDQTPLAHEMGHSLGAPGFTLPHSSASHTTPDDMGFPFPYNSGWDVMSNLWWAGNRAGHTDLTYGRLGVHTIAYHKDLLGWIPPDKKFEASLGTDTQIELRAIDGPLPSILAASQYMMAEIPIPGTNDFYTVEARIEDGYDVGIPTALPDPDPGVDAAVIIHKVNPGLSDSNAQVVDSNNDGNKIVNDLSAMWTAGETFTDAANGITVAIDGPGPNGGFLVTITVSLGECQGQPIVNPAFAGTPGKDNIVGTAGDDVIHGFAGNDKIDGLGGDDIICGGAGNDQLFGGEGNDSIEGNEGNDKIDGGNGNDVLAGQAGKDKITGGEGDDDLFGGTENDKLDGGLGVDDLFGEAGNDNLKGGDGNDTLDGGSENDKLDGGTGDDVLDGGDGNDKLKGAAGMDDLDGGLGNDTLDGGDDNDTLAGGEGDDKLKGGNGDDTLDGEAGVDKLDGGGGIDTCVGETVKNCEP